MLGEKTPLYEWHKSAGAQVIDFGGWDMSVYYSTPIEEHKIVRSSAGLFDVSHMGEIWIEGKDALEVVQRAVSRDISKTPVGKMDLCVMCNEQGGIIDDLTVYKFSNKKILLVVNAGTVKKDFAQLETIAGKMKAEARLSDKTTETGKIDIQGLKAEEILQKATGIKLGEIKFYHFCEGKVDGKEAIVSRSGYTGEDGFEIYCKWNETREIWEKLLELGAEAGIVPCGLGARDTLRLECGYMLYGNDIDEEHTPLEGVYGWVVDFDKKDFVGREALAKQKQEGVSRKLVGFEMKERGIARHGYRVFGKGKETGAVTSGSFSPTLEKNIGMAYVGKEFKEIGTEIEVEIREQKVKAEVVKIPFYKRG